jgi:hypothetical protein
VKLGKNSSDTSEILSKTYVVDTVKVSSAFEGHKQFEEGRDNEEGDERSCRPISHRTDENVEKLLNLAHSDRCLSIRTTAV